MKKLLLITLLFINILANVQAQNAGLANIFEYGVGSRAMGLGNSYVAIADDSSATYWNPGALGLLEYNEIMFLHTTLFFSTFYDYISFAYPTINSGTFGFSISRIGSSDITFRDSHNLITSKNNSIEQMQFLIGYGIKLDFPFDVGTAIKINTFKIGTFSDANIAFDFGLLFQLYGNKWKRTFGNFSLQNLKFGINAKNVLSSPIKLQSKAENEPLTIKMGLSYFFNFDNRANHKILSSIDINFHQKKQIILNAGLEYTLYRIIFLRGGYDQNIGLVTGGGLQHWGFRLDYSLAFQELDLVHRFSLLWRFGDNVKEKKATEEERRHRETEEKIKQAIEKSTKDYKLKINQLESNYKVNFQKTIDDMNKKFQQDQNILLEQEKLKSEEKKQKLIDDLNKKYANERLKTLTALSNKFKEDKKKFARQYDRKINKEKYRLRKKLKAGELFKRKHYTKGIELFEKGDYNGAITEFKSVLRFDPNYSEAKKYLKKTKAAKKDPKTYSKKIMNLYYKGIDYHVTGKYQKAINTWKKILKIDPYNKLAARNINDAEKKLKQLKQIKKNKKGKK